MAAKTEGKRRLNWWQWPKVLFHLLSGDFQGSQHVQWPPPELWPERNRILVSVLAHACVCPPVWCQMAAVEKVHTRALSLTHLNGMRPSFAFWIPTCAFPVWMGQNIRHEKGLLDFLRGWLATHYKKTIKEAWSWKTMWILICFLFRM